MSHPFTLYGDKVVEVVDPYAEEAILWLMNTTVTEYQIEAQTLNHRGGVTSRSYYTVYDKSEMQAKVNHLQKIYQRVLVNKEVRQYK